MEVIRNFRIQTPSRKAIPNNPELAIPKTGGNNNPPLPLKGYTNDNPHDNNKKFNYIEYYLNVVKRLSENNLENRS
jgi:hypothetical protein